MTTDKLEKPAFIQYAQGRGLNVDRDKEGEFTDHGTQIMYEAWKHRADMAEEKIQVSRPAEHSTTGVFLINAMSRDVPRGDLLEHFRVTHVEGMDTVVNVQLTINGIPVDVSATLEDAWTRMQNRYDADVHKSATEKLREMPAFEGLTMLMAKAQRRMKDDLNQLFPGINDEEDY